MAQRAMLNGIRIRFQRWRGVVIGKNVHLGTGVSLDIPYPYFVVIEDGVSLAGGDTILTHNTPMAYHKNVLPSFVAPVILRKNVSVAINVTILPGVEIGEGAIISAGSIVSKNIPPFTVAAGNPAKVVADISLLLKDNYQEDEFQRILKKRAKDFKQFKIQ